MAVQPAGLAALYDTSTAQPLSPSFQYRQGIETVQFTPDGRRVLTAGNNGNSNAPRPRSGSEVNGGSVQNVCDATTDRSLAHFHDAKLASEVARFTANGSQLVIHGNPSRIWDLAPVDAAPAWLADLAEAVGGCRLTATGVVEPLTDRLEARRAVVKKIASLSAADRWAQVAHWVLTEPATRKISSYSAVAVADFVQRRIDRDRLADLEEALRAEPENAEARALFGVHWSKAPDKPKPDHPQDLPRADHETLLATHLGPQISKVWRARAAVLETLGRSAEAGDARRRADNLQKPIR